MNISNSSKVFTNTILTAYIFILLPFVIYSQDYVINNYDVDIKINSDGSLNVEETIDVYFNEKRRGIKKYCPRKYSHNQQTYTVGISNVRTGNDTHKILKEGNNHVIRLGDKDIFIQGKKEYTIQYKLDNTLLNEKNHLEFQYNIVSDWDVSIKQVKYKIHLPKNIDLAFNEFQVYTGMDDEDESNASILRNENTFYGESFKPLDPQENITVAIKLPADYISVRSKNDPPKISILKKDKLWAIPLSIWALFLGLFFRQRKVESPEDITEQYFPPLGFSPAEVGTFHDGQINTRDIISLIPYWAEKGFINVSNNNMSGNQNDIYFNKLKELNNDFPEYEHIIFSNLFKESDTAILSELKNDIYTSYYKATGDLKKNLMNKELYDQENYNLFHSGKLLILSLILVVLGIYLLIGTQFKLSGIAVMLSALTSFVLHFIKPKISAYGQEVRNHLKGLYKFLKNPDMEKTNELLKENPNYFEQLFPYAVAFGLDKSWINKLSDLDLNAPTWYHNTNSVSSKQNSLSSFSSDFSVPEITSVFTSSPGGSSSGGGSFRGGSAGGGYGGGGSSW